MPPIRPLRRPLTATALIERDQASLNRALRMAIAAEQLVVHLLACLGAAGVIGALAQSLPALFPGLFR